jgi:hypothetical protein
MPEIYSRYPKVFAVGILAAAAGAALTLPGWMLQIEVIAAKPRH